MNLNEDYTKLDPSGVEKALTLFPEQIAWSEPAFAVV